MPVTNQQASAGGITFVRPLPDQNLVFYLGDGGTTLYRVNTKDQTQVAVSERSITPITNVQWPKRADVAIVSRPDGNYLFEIPKYNFRNQLFDKVTGPEFISPVWDPVGERVAASLFLPNGEHSLIFADKQFQNVERKADLTGFTNPRLVWSPNGRFIAVINQSKDTAQNNVWVYSLTSSDFSAVTSTGGVVDVSFSPDERTLLLERGSKQLAVHDLETGVERSVGTAGTVQTAAWRDGDSFYLPQPGGNSLLLYNLNGGGTKQIAYTLPATLPVLGMFYFGGSESLVFYTEQAVYTVSMAD
jgi:WD40 repeat protein